MKVDYGGSQDVEDSKLVVIMGSQLSGTSPLKQMWLVKTLTMIKRKTRIIMNQKESLTILN